MTLNFNIHASLFSWAFGLSLTWLVTSKTGVSRDVAFAVRYLMVRLHFGIKDLQYGLTATQDERKQR